ncbi:LexA family transcriptional regulator [Streptomyces cyaneofuscatus]|uniref:LexA family protein n=1 Tax=Streptomyces cyaneofuscatus TaxID=66883 RepID=UPI0036625280
MEHGQGPTVRQIGARVGLSSTSSVAYQLGQLEGRGLISRTGRGWNSCRIGGC